MTDIRSFEPLFGSWYFQEQIGRGSYGDVYRMRRDVNGRTELSAVKHISIEEREDYSIDRQLMVLNREININELLSQEPNIVAYQDMAFFNRPQLDGLDVFVLMELLTPLGRWLKTHQMREADVVRMGMELCNALSALENLGILHRDVKISNIFVSDRGVFKLGDFGVAKSIGSVAYGMTMAGAFNFMAPEIARGGKVLLNADLYSLGIVLYRMMNGGMSPFLAPGSSPSPEEDNAAVQRRLRGEPLPPPANASPGFSSVILRACSYLPDDRYQSAKEMEAALRKCHHFRRFV